MTQSTGCSRPLAASHCRLLLLFVCALLGPSCGEGGESPEPSLPAPSRESWAPQDPWPGFTLITPLQSKRVYLVDMAGEARGARACFFVARSRRAGGPSRE